MEKVKSNYTILATKDGINVVEDHDLGYIHIDPLPSSEALTKLYEDEYFQLDRKEYFEKEKRDKEWNHLNYQDKFTFFEEQLGCKGSVLDIGSGSGHFLAFAQQAGWTAQGIEPSPMACNFSNEELGLQVVNGFYDEASAAELGSFDVIHLRNVLEHLPNPLEILELCKSNLKEGGIICVSVPNDFSPFQKIATEQMDLPAWWIVPNHHLNYFNPTSLAHVLEKTGYTITRKESSFPLDMFLTMGDVYIGNGDIGKQCHQKRVAFDLRLSKYDNNLRRELYQFFAEKNIGRECIVYARK